MAKFLSSLTSKTKPKTVWKAIRKIKGKKSTSSLGHLKVNGKLITDKKQIENLLASTISNNSSSQHYAPKVQAIKAQKAGKKYVKFKSDNSEGYNQPFSLLELKQALQKSNDSAIGPDDIHHKLLTNLLKCSLSLLLTVFKYLEIRKCSALLERSHRSCNSKTR